MTRLNPDADLVRDLVAGQFPQWADLPIAPVTHDGWDNRSFRLGVDLVVRLPSAARYAAQVEKEQKWLPRLATHLPRPIPAPVAMGEPAHGYPWRWSVYRWLEGETATPGRVGDAVRFARDLAAFLAALQRIDPSGGPPPGPHNFHRGGALSIYDGETRAAIDALDGDIDADAARVAWEIALETTWTQPPVWLHGDVSGPNLLVRDGRLCAVIDFGGLGVGDPASDYAIAFTHLEVDDRDEFRAAVPIDDESWARARGWALWKALITLAEQRERDPPRAADARRVIARVSQDVNEVREPTRSVRGGHEP